jgi:hypothetical protein
MGTGESVVPKLSEAPYSHLSFLLHVPHPLQLQFGKQDILPHSCLGPSIASLWHLWGPLSALKGISLLHNLHEMLPRCLLYLAGGMVNLRQTSLGGPVTSFWVHSPLGLPITATPPLPSHSLLYPTIS